MIIFSDNDLSVDLEPKIIFETNLIYDGKKVPIKIEADLSNSNDEEHSRLIQILDQLYNKDIQI